ncbi:MAG: hypothetical protein IT430_08115 [Phycisphaerales bacterium]|nr:hypothetical protein [Phycisphaerales bacterium]
MGLDSVELVMEVEDEFKIRLPDSECEKVRTVADIAALVISKLPRSDGVCASARTFYSLRRQIARLTNLSRSDIRPGVQLATLFPPAKRRKQWAALRAVERNVPHLRASTRAERTLLWMTGFLGLAWLTCSALGWLAYGFSSVAALFSVGAFLAGAWLLTGINARFATHFPADCVTLADLVRLTMPVQFPNAAGDQLIFQHRVMEDVRRLTANQLGLPLDQVKPESHLVNDLGMD